MTYRTICLVRCAFRIARVQGKPNLLCMEALDEIAERAECSNAQDGASIQPGEERRARTNHLASPDW
jgi:hypothetical protein